jgi:hypothetical protein
MPYAFLIDGNDMHDGIYRFITDFSDFQLISRQITVWTSVIFGRCVTRMIIVAAGYNY